MAYENPFADMMKQFSQADMMKQFSQADMMKQFSQFKAPSMPAAPSFDMNQMMNVGRKNAEACTAATQALTESCQAISRRQAELARTQVEKTLKACKDMLTNATPEANTTKQVELAKSAFESSFNNLREVYELVTKSNLEAFDKLSRRTSQSIEELSATATSTSAKKKAA
jgi:phasin family protein